MTETFTAEELAATADAAVPYPMDGETRLRANLCPIRTIPAGGINTSIASLANWRRFHLDKGTFEGQRPLSPTLIQELQMPWVCITASQFAEFQVGDNSGLRPGAVRAFKQGRLPGPSGGWERSHLQRQGSGSRVIEAWTRASCTRVDQAALGIAVGQAVAHADAAAPPFEWALIEGHFRMSTAAPTAVFEERTAVDGPGRKRR